MIGKFVSESTHPKDVEGLSSIASSVHSDS